MIDLAPVHTGAICYDCSKSHDKSHHIVGNETCQIAMTMTLKKVPALILADFDCDLHRLLSFKVANCN